MNTPIKIENIDDPRISIFKSMKSKLFQNDDYFIADTEKVILKVIQKQLEIKTLLAPFEFFENYESYLSNANIENSFSTSIKLLENIVGFRLHKGAMALVKKPLNADITQMINDKIIVILNGTSEAENVGVICRNSAGFGINSLIVDKKTSHPYIRRSVRVSMGHLFDLKVHETNNLNEAIKVLKKNNFTIIAAEIDPRSIPLNELIVDKKTAIIFGSEHPGVDPQILSICDKIIKIPMKGTVTSLNVASASAVFLNHLVSSQVK